MGRRRRVRESRVRERGRVDGTNRSAIFGEIEKRFSELAERSSAPSARSKIKKNGLRHFPQLSHAIRAQEVLMTGNVMRTPTIDQ